MAADLGKAYVQIIPSAKGISAGMAKAIEPGVKPTSQKISQGIGAGIRSGMQTVGGGLMKAGAVATMVSVPIIAGIKKAMSAYETQHLAEQKLTEIYRTRMGATKAAAKETMALASALQKEGVIGDEVQLSGAQQLATFAKYPSTVNTILPAMNNLLAQQKGLNATSEDATSIANLMGKAMQGQTGALRRVGITFDEDQEKVLKFGTEEERAAMLSKVITENVGNMNKRLAETPEGKIQQLKNTMGDLTERIGGALAPVLSQMASYVGEKILPKVEQLIGFLEKNPIIAKIVVGLTAMLAIGGPLLAMLGAVISGVGALAGVVSAPVLAIGALVAVLAVGAAKCKPFRDALADLAKTVLPPLKSMVAALVPVLNVIISEVGKMAAEIAAQMVPVLKELTPVMSAIMSAIGKVVSVLAKVLVPAVKVAIAILKGSLSLQIKIAGTILKTINSIIKTITGFVKSVKTAWNNIKTTTKTVWNSILTALSGTFKKILSTAQNVIAKIKGFFRFAGLAGTVRGIWNNVKNSITKPIESAKNTISKIISKIRGLFPLHIGNIFSGLKLPHFSVSGGKAPFGIGGKGSLPKLSVQWYAKGGIVDGATLIGAGEKGKEAILPLDEFWRKLDSIKAGNTTVYNIGDVTLNVKDLEDVLTLEDFIAVIKRAKAFA